VSPAAQEHDRTNPAAAGRADSREALFESRDVFTLSRTELRGLRKKIQMIFQDPYSSLNPRKRSGPAWKRR